MPPAKGEAVSAHNAARKLYSCAKRNGKLGESLMAGMEIDEAVTKCERLLLMLSEQLRGVRGGRLKPTVIAVALARLAGCGTSDAAIARQIDASLVTKGNQISRVAERIMAHSHLWQDTPEWDAGVADETGLDGGCDDAFPNDAAATESPAASSSCHTHAQRCATCNQPPKSEKSYWSGYSAIDLNSMPTCVACHLPRVPHSLMEAAEMANEQKGEMNDRFDQARVAPRPHEHAWFLQSAAAKAMGELLRKGQSTLPWDKIVALADNPTDFPVGAPLKVKCSCCGARRNFDFVFGTLQRLQHEATVARRENQTTREASFLDSPAIIKFNNTVVPKAVAAIEKQCATRRKAPKMDDMLWPQCTNCEADEAMAAFRVQQPTSARKAAESLGLGPKKPKVGAPRTLDCAVPIHGTELVQMLPKSVQNAEELAIPDKLSMGILLVEKEPLAALLSERHCSRYEDLVGAPDVHNLFAEPTSIGQEVETRKAAGGDDVDAAAVIVAPKALIDTLQHREKHERADAFRALWLQPHNGMEAVGFALLNNELPDAGDILTEQREFFAKRNERIRGHTDEQIDAKCETQRVGKVTSWASLLRNPDFVDYSRMWGVAGGREHVNHMLLVVKPGGDLSHALLIYPSGPRGRASKKLQKAARRCDGAETRCDDQWGRPKKRQKTEKDIARLRLCYGQPRSVVVVPGRPFFDASLSENRALQQHDGPFGQRARVLAHCGLISMLALAAMGLAPRPDEEKDEWLNVRKPLVLGDGIAHTAVYTWRCLELHAKAPRLAIHALACIQGFYENFYPATLHFDTDRYCSMVKVSVLAAQYLVVKGS